jgi:hypothetical protein
MNRMAASVVALCLAVTAGPASAGGKVAQIKRCGIVIGAPGSYAVAANLAGGVGSRAANCISIDADDVSIDLGGYHVDCDDNGYHGIYVAAGRNGVTNRNGMIADCGEGISASGATGMLVDEVLVLSNSSHGMRIGPNSTVMHSIGFGNTGYGIMVECPVNVPQNVSVANYQWFYFGGAGCTSTDNATQ